MLKNKIFLNIHAQQCQSTLNFPSRHQLIKLLSNSTFQYEVITPVNSYRTGTWVPYVRAALMKRYIVRYPVPSVKKDQDLLVKTKKTYLRFRQIPGKQRKESERIVVFNNR
jgi:hypothetical protein